MATHTRAELAILVDNFAAPSVPRIRAWQALEYIALIAREQWRLPRDQTIRKRGGEREVRRPIFSILPYFQRATRRLMTEPTATRGPLPASSSSRTARMVVKICSGTCSDVMKKRNRAAFIGTAG